MITPLAYINLYLTLASTAVINPDSSGSSDTSSGAADAPLSLELVTAVFPPLTEAGTLLFDPRFFSGNGLQLFEAGSWSVTTVLQNLPVTYPSLEETDPDNPDQDADPDEPDEEDVTTTTPPPTPRKRRRTSSPTSTPAPTAKPDSDPTAPPTSFKTLDSAVHWVLGALGLPLWLWTLVKMTPKAVKYVPLLLEFYVRYRFGKWFTHAVGTLAEYVCLAVNYVDAFFSTQRFVWKPVGLLDGSEFTSLLKAESDFFVTLQRGVTARVRRCNLQKTRKITKLGAFIDLDVMQADSATVTVPERADGSILAHLCKCGDSHACRALGADLHFDQVCIVPRDSLAPLADVSAARTPSRLRGLLHRAALTVNRISKWAPWFAIFVASILNWRFMTLVLATKSITSWIGCFEFVWNLWNEEDLEEAEDGTQLPSRNVQRLSSGSRSQVEEFSMSDESPEESDFFAFRERVRTSFGNPAENLNSSSQSSPPVRIGTPAPPSLPRQSPLTASLTREPPRQSWSDPVGLPPVAPLPAAQPAVSTPLVRSTAAGLQLSFDDSRAGADAGAAGARPDTVTADALLSALQLLRGRDERDELERRGDVIGAMRQFHSIYHLGLNFFGRLGTSEYGQGSSGPDLFRKLKGLCSSADGQAAQLNSRAPTQLNNRIIQGMLLGSYSSASSESGEVKIPNGKNGTWTIPSLACQDFPTSAALDYDDVSKRTSVSNHDLGRQPAAPTTWNVFFERASNQVAMFSLMLFYQVGYVILLRSPSKLF